LLIETHGGDVNVQDKNKNTPLHVAFEYFNPNDGGDIAVLTYLINQNNADVNIKNCKGHNMLLLALINNFELNSGSDTILSRFVEIIAERCVQQVLDETVS
jgi:ankyrin repeat protein